MSHYQESPDRRRRSSEAPIPPRHHRHGSEYHPELESTENESDATPHRRERFPSQISEGELRFARGVIASSTDDFLVWKEDVINEYKAQVEMMVAQNYAEKCQKFVFDGLLPLTNELKGIPNQKWGSDVERRVECITRLTPYAERARLKAENRYMLTKDHCLDAVLARERQNGRSKRIRFDLDALEEGLRVSREWR